TGVGDLSINELVQIDRIFVTHSHMDHVAMIPFIVDTVGWLRDKPLALHAIPETLAILKEHLFNWKLWPDFSQIPSAANPVMRYEPVELGRPVALGARRVTPLPANHVVPAVGYHLDSGNASLVFTGDTTRNDALWPVVNRIANLKYLIIETALSDRDRELAVLSKHLCPALLAEELGRLSLVPAVYVTHLKPRESELIMQQVATTVSGRRVRMLQNNQVFEF
ncbi:MAG TPA: 3',5'-cyclic-nucleotide phosphodiesterase, partial [Burkholderiales bacterium]|nr:3',5'-cyclic-nucleotide phosphodiesterase [Burkholderiales bacterium]